MNHPRWSKGDLEDGVRGSDGEWFEKVLGVAHGAKVVPLWRRQPKGSGDRPLDQLADQVVGEAGRG